MLTIFSIPKPFQGHISDIQCNAIRSWLALDPRPEIILCGDDAGVADAARQFGAKHLPDIARNSFGTPLLSSAFASVQRTARKDVICYVNCDILFCSDLPRTVERIPFSRYLLVGQRWNVDVSGVQDFAEGWRERIRERVREDGILHTPTGIDYFVFPAGSIGELPAFAVGRPGWDPWMIYRARTLRIPVIDATGAILAVHQNHDYQHIPQQRTPGTFDGPEGDRNMELVGPMALYFTIHDATHVMTEGGVEPARAEPYLTSRLYRLSCLDTAQGLLSVVRRRVVWWMSGRRDGAFGGPIRHLITWLAP